MLSYRHAYHAGNHADVLKHLILVHIAQYLGEKPAPFWIIDTHAGAGLYALESAQAMKLAEWQDGIGRLWQASGLPPALAEYLDFVKILNPDASLKHYPGSPWLAQQCLRAHDRLRLFELHSSDARILRENFNRSGRQINISESDGLAGLKALLPPPPRRALVLIDPSYETASDYGNVVKTLQDAVKRFATGTYALWYPLLPKREARELPQRLQRLGCRNWLNATLEVRAPAGNGFGMYGSGMFIINPPWTLEKTLHTTLPVLTRLLAQDEGARYTLESQGD
ncbi:23S rRNA (adenine(2030)-N(6))-methyltransferase RlmJ [Azonexus sp.]|uniref:23S rRNA (adenine(2030)-N(6))-methyltransferase RlmJ n=1 Tax=Azonexus sp. TaxID=1872668 RepID=UPI0039E35F19